MPALQFPLHDVRRDEKVTVYPRTKNAALAVRHPQDGPLLASGSSWTADGFTARLLIDRTITTNAAEGWKDDRVPYDPTIPPPHATQVPIEPPTLAVTTRKAPQKP